jgi:hypothetical protein
MKNREYQPKNLKTLRKICNEGNISFPISDENDILIEIRNTQDNPIYRNFPSRTYSIKSTDPWEIVELLAYEAHEWQAYEILRSFKQKNNLYKFPLLT